MRLIRNKRCWYILFLFILIQSVIAFSVYLKKNVNIPITFPRNISSIFVLAILLFRGDERPIDKDLYEVRSSGLLLCVESFALLTSPFACSRKMLSILRLTDVDFFLHFPKLKLDFFVSNIVLELRLSDTYYQYNIVTKNNFRTTWLVASMCKKLIWCAWKKDKDINAIFLLI